MIKRMLIMLVGLAILFGIVFGFKAYKNEKIAEKVAANRIPIITVSSTQPKSETWRNTLTEVGSTVAVNGVNVTTEMAGMVEHIYFNGGGMIKKGALLVTLDIRPEVAKLHSLEAQARYAKITYFRNIKQNRIGAISDETLAQNKADYESTKANVAEEKATIALKEIHAPFSGKLGINLINQGQYLNPGDKIVSLQTLSPIYVNVNLPQQTLPSLKIGQTVAVTSDSFPNKTFTGKISTINPQVDSATRNIEIQATFPNQDSLLVPGMFVHATLDLGSSEHYLTLPLTAITFNPYGNMVYILKPTTQTKNNQKVYEAIQTFVTLGEQKGNEIAVIKGITSNDTVVSSGGFKLKNHSLVVINNTVQPLSTTDPKPTQEYQ